ncbi:MAG TPA: DUF3877 family protein [Candidatus Merdenecus merdavium]|nr:DUF3877 family protein [Candidatus Merdenecus merdavium]
MKYNYAHLEKNISDMIFEGLLKIGYFKEQRISIYYDKGLLSYLLGVDYLEEEEYASCFKGFKEYVSSTLPDLVIKRQKERFEFSVSSEGVSYIYHNNSSRKFLKELIDVLNKKECTLEEIIHVFESVSKEIVVDHVEHPEFQYVIYFKDKDMDEFKYCISFDEMGHYYHRLIDYDFHKIMDSDD